MTTNVRADSLRPGDTILVRQVPHRPGHFDEATVRAVEPTTTTVRTEHGSAPNVKAVRVHLSGWWTVLLAGEGVALVRRAEVMP